jgi:hypothetical protein
MNQFPLRGLGGCFSSGVRGLFLAWCAAQAVLFRFGIQKNRLNQLQNGWDFRRFFSNEPRGRPVDPGFGAPAINIGQRP